MLTYIILMAVYAITLTVTILVAVRDVSSKSSNPYKPLLVAHTLALGLVLAVGWRIAFSAGERYAANRLFPRSGYSEYENQAARIASMDEFSSKFRTEEEFTLYSDFLGMNPTAEEIRVYDTFLRSSPTTRKMKACNQFMATDPDAIDLHDYQIFLSTHPSAEEMEKYVQNRLQRRVKLVKH